MNKACILVPTFPPHFQYAYRLKKSYFLYGFDKQADLYFIFTNSLEKESFGDWDKTLILPKNLSFSKKRGIINIKKLYGLLQLKNKYKYIFVMDDETQFIKSYNLELVCKKFFARKILYGNEIFEESYSFVNDVLKHCKSHFQGSSKLPAEYTMFWLWFNQPCIYDTSTLNDFFKKTHLDKNLSKLSFFDFDYYIYMTYLILYKGFHITNINNRALFGAVEATNLKEIDLEILTLRKVTLYQATSFMRKYVNQRDLFLIVHNDRVEAKNSLSISLREKVSKLMYNWLKELYNA